MDQSVTKCTWKMGCFLWWINKQVVTCTFQHRLFSRAICFVLASFPSLPLTCTVILIHPQSMSRAHTVTNEIDVAPLAGLGGQEPPSLSPSLCLPKS